MSDRFEVRLRTIYRDIESLNNAGVPILGEIGVGYSMMEGYSLPPVMFTQEEAFAFLMAEKIIDKYADTENNKLFQSALWFDNSPPSLMLRRAICFQAAIAVYKPVFSCLIILLA
jgi:predicted DNA-binding transcriptional regulator YafY